MGKWYMLRSRVADGLWPFIRSRLFSLLTSTQHFSELKDLESKELIKNLPQLVGNFTLKFGLGFIYWSSRYFHRKKSWSSPQDLASAPLGGGNEINKFRTTDSRRSQNTTSIHSFMYWFILSVYIHTCFCVCGHNYLPMCPYATLDIYILISLYATVIKMWTKRFLKSFKEWKKKIKSFFWKGYPLKLILCTICFFSIQFNNIIFSM